MSTGARLGILAGIIVVAIAVLVIAGGGDDNKKSTTATTSSTAAATKTDTTTTTTQAKPAGPPTYTVNVKNAKPVGGVEEIDVKKGDRVKLVVKSDTADQIHIHGYNLSKAVKPGVTARFNFKATIDGNFEIELENLGEQIAKLTVEP